MFFFPLQYVVCLLNTDILFSCEIRASLVGLHLQKALIKKRLSLRECPRGGHLSGALKLPGKGILRAPVCQDSGCTSAPWTEPTGVYD